MNKYLILFLMGISTLLSCTKAQLTGQSLSMKVDGTDWTATSITATSSSGAILIDATKSDGSYMEIGLPWPIPLGTYRYTSQPNEQFNYRPTNEDKFEGEIPNDYVMIDSYNNGVLKGRFNGTVFRSNSTFATKDIENGSFKVNVK